MLKPVCKWNALEEPKRFRRALAGWFEKEAKDYPWRRTQDPYAVLVSEVMLQQTQIATVLGRGFYTRFLEKFPDVSSLAKAADEALMKAWEGLGYYRRARMLREAAREVVEKHEGVFPEVYDDILNLPGVGRYTAGAVYSFAFGKPAAVVDGNVARVFSRLMNSAAPIDQGATQKVLWQWAEDLLDEKSPRVHNSALMELGQMVCRPGVPDCMLCPVSAFCQSSEPQLLPKKAKRVKLTEVDEPVVFVEKNGQVLLSKQAEGRRVGMWRLPEREDVSEWPMVHERRYTITRYKVRLMVHRAEKGVSPRSGEQWHMIESLEDLVMPPADRAALMAVLGE